MNKWGYSLFLFTAMTLWAQGAYADLVDPTKPPNLSTIRDNFTLTAIMISPDHRLAVINGKIVHVGDQLDTIRVTAINENNVEIDGPNGKVRLVLDDLFAGRPVKISK
jgi:hypothetical protein